jgi:SAM-dependent methyltransferase
MTTDWGRRADELSRAAYGDGRPTAWFDELYAAGATGEVSMPWDRGEPQVLLREWAESTGLSGQGRRAVVVGSGLGADAEYVASLGFETTGFDIAETAVRLARERHPGTSVDYRVADLLALPDDLVGAFDLVVEIFTIQALPDPPRAAAIAGVRSLVAPGGILLAIQFRYDGTEPADVGPPFPQTEETMRSIAADGLEVVRLEEVEGARWRCEYRRAG